MAKWCDEGESLLGNIFLKNATQVSMYLGLYLDADEPAETAALSELTEPTEANGYARIQLDEADWTEQDTKGEFRNVEKTFVASGGNWGTIYGYFLCSAATGTDGSLIAVENFSDGPYVMNDTWDLRITAVVVIA